jgi:hypothetical protein
MERYRFSYTNSCKLHCIALCAPDMTWACSSGRLGGLTPVQRLRQAEPSWFRSGQTTTLFSSFTENEPVNGARGGIASIGKSISSAEPCTGSRVGFLAVNGSCEAMKHLYEARRELQVLYQNSNGSVSSVAKLAEAWNCSGARLWRLRGAESMSSAGSSNQSFQQEITTVMKLQVSQFDYALCK